MAYKTEYIRQCETMGCKSRATFEVRAYGNQTHGYHCAKHADLRVKELDRAESMNPAGFK